MKEKPEQDRVKTTIRLPRDVWRSLQHYAIDTETSAESIVELALRDYLAHFGVEVKNQMLRGKGRKS
jgi:hypothetical protein